MKVKKIKAKWIRNIKDTLSWNRAFFTIRTRNEDTIDWDKYYWVSPIPYKFEQDWYTFTVVWEKKQYALHLVKEIIKLHRWKQFKIIPNVIPKKFLSELDKLFILADKRPLTEQEENRLSELYLWSLIYN